MVSATNPTADTAGTRHLIERINTMRLLFCYVLIAVLCAVPTVAMAQEEGGEAPQLEQEEQVGEQGEEVGVDIQGEEETQGGSMSIPTFTVLPTKKNTYVVTRDLRGLQCVTGVGDKNSCAVIRGAAVGNDYPWDSVKCRPGDSSVGTYASLLDNNRAVNIFAAPPALMTSADTYTINVRLGRVCLKK
jgi:hypothetical protein